MRQVHQLIAGANIGDAITNYAFEIKNIFNNAGIISYIFSPIIHTAPEYMQSNSVRNQEELPSIINDNDILIYHYSIGSTSTEIYMGLNCQKAICYHNITPKKYFKTLSKEQSNDLEAGRKKLIELKDSTIVAFADSNYNRLELEELGYKNTKTVPLVFPTSYLNIKPTMGIINKYSDDYINFLFVGRVVPNKRFEDIIKMFVIYNKTINTKSRLFLVGSHVGNEKYYTFLKSLSIDLGCKSSVFFSGQVTTNDLVAYYNIGNVFICLSEHEGFGLPLIESMHFNIPVFALNNAAIPETLGGAGVLIKEKNHIKIAELINSVLSKPELKKEILEKQKKRVEDFSLNSLKKNLSKLLNDFFSFELKI